MGFVLASYLLNSRLAGRLVNVLVCNPAWGVPLLFRWFESVHTRQAANPAIIDAIVRGLDLPPPDEAHDTQ